ncbi:MAG: hypothetical protein ABJB74_09490 [Gemmatimonas sp.]
MSGSTGKVVMDRETFERSSAAGQKPCTSVAIVRTVRNVRDAKSRA